MEGDGKEEFYVTIRVFEELIDLEGLVPRSAEETFHLFIGGHGKVDLRPKARDRE